MSVSLWSASQPASQHWSFIDRGSQTTIESEIRSEAHGQNGGQIKDLPSCWQKRRAIFKSFQAPEVGNGRLPEVTGSQVRNFARRFKWGKSDGGGEEGHLFLFISIAPMMRSFDRPQSLSIRWWRQSLSTEGGNAFKWRRGDDGTSYCHKFCYRST